MLRIWMFAMLNTSLVFRLFCVTLLILISSGMTHAFERAKVAQTSEQVSPLLNGQFVPDVILQTTFGKDIRLLDLVESRASIILFYRGGWCPYCNRQMAGLIEVEQQILDLGYQIIVISPDSPERLREQQFGEEFDVIRLSDSSLQATRAFGLAYYVPDTVAQQYKTKLGAELVTVDGESKRVLPVPSAFIADVTGLVKFQYVNPNYKVRIEPQLLYYAARIAK
jgi:peroxiredoxin